MGMFCAAEEIAREIGKRAGGSVEHFELIRAKAGVHVCRCRYNGRPAVAKYYENEDDRREIENYRILMKLGVPVMEVFALCRSCMVMEDIEASDTWRLGAEEDMADPQVLCALARWYFALHEAGGESEHLADMWSENDGLNLSAVELIRAKLPGAEELCGYVEAHLDKLRAVLRARENTMTYNDFYYTNFLIRKDRSAAMMFDYNLMGRGYRYADFRNVESSVSPEAFAAFMEEYDAQHRAKYGERFEISGKDRRLDEFISPFLGLASAFRRETFPFWAEEARAEAVDGTLLERARSIVEELAD